jgi:hypothetical protein
MILVTAFGGVCLGVEGPIVPQSLARINVDKVDMVTGMWLK